MAVRGYRAGTAFVEVVPVFGDNQRDIAQVIREKLAQKDIYKPLEDNLNKAVREGLKDLPDQTVKVIDEVDRRAVKVVKEKSRSLGQDSVKEFQKAVDKGMGGFWGDMVNKAARDARRALRGSTRDVAKVSPFAPLAEQINTDLDLLEKALTDGGENQTRNITRAYERLQRKLNEATQLKVGRGGISQVQMTNLRSAAETLGGRAEQILSFQTNQEYRDLLADRRKAEREHAAEQKKIADDEARAERERVAEQKKINQEQARVDRDAAKETEKTQREHNRQVEQERDRHDRAMSELSARELKRRSVDAARERARGEREGHDLYRSRMQAGRDQAQDFGRERPGSTMRQRRLINQRDQSVERARAQIRALMSDLSKVNTSQTRVHFDTGEAQKQVEHLTRRLAVFQTRDFTAEIGVDDRDVRRKLNEMRGQLEALQDFEFDIDLADDEARRKLQRFKVMVENMKKIDLEADIPREEVVNLQRKLASISRLVKNSIQPTVELDTKGVAADVATLNAALDAIRDKRIGVDITEAEALANIRTVQASLDSLRDKEVDIDVDVDVDRIRDFNRGISVASVRIQRLNRRVRDAGISMAESTQAFRVFSPILAGIAFAGAPIVSLLGGITAGLGGIISIAPGAAASLTPVIFAFSGMEDAVKAYEQTLEESEAVAVARAEVTAARAEAEGEDTDRLKEAKEALADAQDKATEASAEWAEQVERIGPAGAEWIKFMDSAGDQMNELARHAREGFLPGFQSGLETILGTYADPFGDFLERSGTQLGGIADDWGRLLSGPSAGAWFMRVGQDSAKYTDDFAQAIANTASGLGNLVDAFRPFAYEISDWLVGVTGRFDTWAAGLIGNSKFARFLDSIRATLPLIGDLGKGIAEFFINATIALEPFTIAILDAINGALDFLNALDPKVLGAILGAIGGLTAGLMLLAGVMAGVGATAQIIAAASSSLFTRVALGLAGFVAVNATALGAMAATGEATTVFGDSALGLAGALSHVADFGHALMGVMTDLFHAVEPLLPAVADLTVDVIELGVGFGQVLLAAAGPFIDILGIVVDVFTALPGGVQEATLAILALAIALPKIKAAAALGLAGLEDKLLGIAVGFDKWGEKLPGISTLTDGASKAFTGFADKLGILGIAAGAAALVIGRFYLANEGAKYLLGQVSPPLEDINRELKALADNATAGAGALQEGFGNRDTFVVFTSGINDMTEALVHLDDRSAHGLEGLDRFTEAVILGNQATEGARQGIKDYDTALADMVSGGNAAAAQEAFAKIAQDAYDNGVNVDFTAGRFKEYRAQLEKTAEQLGITQLTEEEYIDWMLGNVPPAVERAVEASGDQAAGMAGVRDTTEEAEEATRDLISATDEWVGRQVTQEEATTRYGDAMTEYEKKLAGAKKGMDEFTDTGQDNRKMFEDAARAARTKADADVLAGESVLEVGERMWDVRQSIIDNAIRLGIAAEDADDYADSLLGIPDHVDSETELIGYLAHKQEADELMSSMEDLDSTDAHPAIGTRGAKQAQDDIDLTAEKLRDTDGKGANVWVKLWRWFVDAGKSDESGPGYTVGRSHGGIDLMPMAAGGLLEPIAQMVKPNTWRIVGDRMDVDEAFIPLDGSKRSVNILLETLARMPGFLPMAGGGILAMQTGGILAPGAPAAPEGDATPEAGNMAAVSEAFTALAALLTTGWADMLTQIVGQTTAFFTTMTEISTVWTTQEVASAALYRANELAADQVFRETFLVGNRDHQVLLSGEAALYRANELAADQVFRETFLVGNREHRALLSGGAALYRANELAADQAFRGTFLAGNREHRALLSGESASWRSTEFAGLQRLYFGQLIPTSQTGQAQLRQNWSNSLSQMGERSYGWRTNELDRFQYFLHTQMMYELTSFGTHANREWSRIWTELTDSATGIFSQLPGEIGQVLVDVSGKLNAHIVDPFNKIISDLELKDIDKLGQFPTQSYASGGHIGIMPGYTPGRDIHRFYSQTGGILELSGGEPVLRPEAGVVLGADWVNGVNTAARTGGVNAVKNFLSGGRQAFADGGVWRNLWGIVNEQFPGARLTSAYRPRSGGSYHAQGRAVDVAGPARMDAAYMMRIFNFLHDNYGNSAELIYTPARGRNILNGRYHTYSPAVQRDHFDHVHWANRMRFSDVVGPPTGQAGGYGMFDLVGGMKGWLEAARKDIAEEFIPQTTMSVADTVFSALATEHQDAFILDHAFSDPGSPGGGVGRWTSLVRQALEHVGQPTSESMINTVLRRMSQESRGNPQAINNWDINARRGTPSKGLMQVIDPTFQAHRDRSLGNDIWDPFQNIVASLLYTISRYGSVPAGYNRRGGYALGTAGIDLSDLGVDSLLRDAGGPVPSGYSIIQNNLGHEETIIPQTTADVARLFQEIDLALNDMQAGPGVVFEHAEFKADPMETAEAISRTNRMAIAAMPRKIG